MTDGQTIPKPLELDGYDAAVRAENEQRDMAFLALLDETGAYQEQICGVPVNALTTPHLLLLNLAGSPFVGKSRLTGESVVPEIVKFLRVVQTDQSGDVCQRNRAILEKIKAIPFETVLDAIWKYMDDAFADMPGSDAASPKRYYSSAASTVYFLGNKLHLHPKDALQIPLKIVWQLMKVDRVCNDPDAVLFNPSDRIITQHLKEANQ